MYRTNNITCGANCKYRTAAALCTVETVCLRYVIVNSVRNGDNRDDDDDDDDNNNNNNRRGAAVEQRDAKTNC